MSLIVAKFILVWYINCLEVKSLGSEEVRLEVKAENYHPFSLDKIEVVGFMKNALKRLIDETKRLASGLKTFYAIYVEGLYGSGKTLLMRKYAHEVLKHIENVIPIYVYLGAQDFKPYTILSNYYTQLNTYVERGIPKPTVIGLPQHWSTRLKVLKDAIEKVKGLEAVELEKFYKVLNVLVEQGFYPLVIFDEFERLLYTGEGLRSDEGIKQFVEFVRGYLEIVRGQRYIGIFALVSTFPIIELLRRAINLRMPHIRVLSELLGRDLEKEPEQFPMIAPHITYDDQIRISWTAVDLDLLARRYKLIVHEDVINLIARVLPTPRAVINIANEAILRGVKGVVTKENFIKIIEPRYLKFKERLKEETINGRFIVTPRSKWLEHFEVLLSSGYFEITSSKYLDVAKSLGIEFEEGVKESERKARQKVSNVLRKLRELGLYEAKGAGEYILNPYLLAYLLNVERLPTGEPTSLDTLISDIKLRVREIRKRRKIRKEE